MRRDKWYRKPEMIVALSALLISLVTTIIAVYSAYIDRSIARASIWPRLEVFRSFGYKEFEYQVTNSGNGPALIRYAEIRYQSKPIKRWKELPDIPRFTQSHLGTRILSQQNNIKPLYYQGEKVNVLLELDKSIEIDICYCSIFNECWLTNRENEPKSVDSCKVDSERAFQQ